MDDDEMMDHVTMIWNEILFVFGVPSVFVGLVRLTAGGCLQFFFISILFFLGGGESSKQASKHRKK